jgi:2-polyprenyl-6-methoxyphenol hydroxylase-like FAD-dependent oxidoreductase
VLTLPTGIICSSSKETKMNEQETIFPEFLTYTLPTQPTSWHKGPGVLLGDAVHAISPSSGQGASMALEDAEILARCL